MRDRLPATPPRVWVLLLCSCNQLSRQWDFACTPSEINHCGQPRSQASRACSVIRRAEHTSEMRGLTLVHMSMRPTMSVLLTPSVRLIILKRPIFLTCAYASVPSAHMH